MIIITLSFRFRNNFPAKSEMDEKTGPWSLRRYLRSLNKPLLIKWCPRNQRRVQMSYLLSNFLTSRQFFAAVCGKHCICLKGKPDRTRLVFSTEGSMSVFYCLVCRLPVIGMKSIITNYIFCCWCLYAPVVKCRLHKTNELKEA